jgi:multisubunit Na+/H+ antiporter MnhC subunit
MKAAIVALFGFGFFLLVAAKFFGIVLLIIGLAIIGGGLCLEIRPGGILGKESAQVISANG